MWLIKIQRYTNRMHDINPNQFGAAAAATGQVHVPYENFARDEIANIRQALAKRKNAATPKP
jgi:hypothetical protein